MLAHLGTRTLVGAVVVAGVVTLTFLLVRLAPGDPVERLLGPTATPAQLAAQRHALGLDRPLAAQYTIWLARFVRGDWGRSIATGRPVRELLGDAVPATVALVGTSLILSYLLGLAVGAWQSGAGPRVDAALSVTTVTLFALPGFWLGLMLAMAFTYWAHWLPAFGATGLDANALTGWSRLADRLRHFALPLATLTLIGIGGAARFVRGAMRDVRSQAFVRTAEAKGLSPFRVTRRHVARNALIPVITLIGLSLPALFSVAVLAIVTGAAVAGPLVSSGSPTAQHDVVATRFLRPLATDHSGNFHPLGTDRFGRDVWTRLVYGARVSLTVGVLAVLLSIVIGVLVGGVAGFWPGPVRTALLALTDFVLALPRVVLLLLLAAMARPSTVLVIVVLGLTGWMSVARLVHGEVRSLAARPFVEGAVALGLSRRRVLARHVLPNALTPVIVSAALGLGNAITLEASLSFLGVGVQPPTPSWGNMIASGRDTLVNAPWVAAAPGIALVLVVVACTLLGDALQDALNPTTRYQTAR